MILAGRKVDQLQRLVGKGYWPAVRLVAKGFDPGGEEDWSMMRLTKMRLAEEEVGNMSCWIMDRKVVGRREEVDRGGLADNEIR